MNLTDIKPSRLGLTTTYLTKFINIFFENNPLSLISLASAEEDICKQQVYFSSIQKTEFWIINFQFDDCTLVEFDPLKNY